MKFGSAHCGYCDGWYGSGDYHMCDQKKAARPPMDFSKMTLVKKGSYRRLITNLRKAKSDADG